MSKMKLFASDAFAATITCGYRGVWQQVESAVAMAKVDERRDSRCPATGWGTAQASWDTAQASSCAPTLLRSSAPALFLRCCNSGDTRWRWYYILYLGYSTLATFLTSTWYHVIYGTYHGT